MSGTIELLVEGAGCQGCVTAIEGALRATDGVVEAHFDLESKTAAVVTDRSVADLIAAIDTAGYDAVLKV